MIAKGLSRAAPALGDGLSRGGKSRGLERMEEGMGRNLTIGAAVVVCAFFLGCATQQQSGGAASEDVQVEYIRDSYKPVSLPENDPNAGQQLVSKAKSALGTPYVYGGSAPGGFDCSGLVKWAYNSVGVTLPRTAREQSVVGEKVASIEEMRAGDIVAFRHPKRGYHTGIYVGEGKFIHAPRKKTHVRLQSLSDPYFSKTLLGARRVNMASGENLVAQANERLDKMIAEATNLTVSAKNVRARKAQRAHDLLADKSKRTAREVASRSKKAKAQATASLKHGKKASLDKASAKKSGSAAKSTARGKNAQAKGLSAKAKAPASKAKTVASNTKAKKAQAGKAPAKKQSSKTVSMLDKKPSKPAQRRKQS